MELPDTMPVTQGEAEYLARREAERRPQSKSDLDRMDFTRAYESLYGNAQSPSRERRLSDYLGRARAGLESSSHRDYMRGAEGRALAGLFGEDQSALRLQDMMKRNAGLAAQNVYGSAQNLGLNEVASRRLQENTRDRYLRDAELEQARIDKLREEELSNLAKDYYGQKAGAALGGIDYQMQDLLARQGALDALRRGSADYLLGAAREDAGLEASQVQNYYNNLANILGTTASVGGSLLASGLSGGGAGAGAGGLPVLGRPPRARDATKV